MTLDPELTEGDDAPGAARLTDDQLARAASANPRWRERLGPTWPSDAQLAAAGAAPLQGPGDFAFAEAVAAYQLKKGLGFDGICGKVTAASLRNVAAPAPVGAPLLIVGGEPLPAPGCRVVPFTDPDGLSFVDRPVWRRRPPDSPVDLFVLHHDGCRSSRQCYDVLIERGLSVHLMLDRDGTIYQALDLLTAQAFHAGPVNARSVGVEICNPELVERNDPDDPRPVMSLEVTNAGSAGARRQVLGFYPKQVEAVVSLARAISAIFRLPANLPAATSPTSTAGVTRRVDPRVLAGGFSGTCGHYHVKDAKVDPGVSLWQPLRNAGFDVA
jgi:N-acetyl-anhydromuramyl-L-alanine amidase AmpD